VLDDELDEIIDKILEERKIELSDNQREQIKSLLVRKLSKEEWDGKDELDVAKLIDYRITAKKASPLN
jgi:hypothetical protein